MNYYQSHVLLFVVVYENCHAGFTEMPASQNVSVGISAEFRCQYNGADIIRWRVNGNLISIRNPPQGTAVDGDTLRITLGEPGVREVECVAQFDNGSPDEVSDVAILRGIVTKLCIMYKSLMCKK